MKSYSKVFKAYNLSILEEVKIICQPPPLNIVTLNSSEKVGNSTENENSKESLICYELIQKQEANEKAQSIRDSAKDSARYGQQGGRQSPRRPGC